MMTSLVKLPGFGGNFHYLLIVLDSDLGDTAGISQVSSTASHICSQDLPHQLKDTEGDTSQGEMLSSQAQTNPPSTMGRFNSSQENVKPSPSAGIRLSMSHSCDPTSKTTGKVVGFREVIFKSYFQTTECMERRVRFPLQGITMNTIKD